MMKKTRQLASLVQTCPAHPSQWEGQLVDRRHVYIRYRWGELSVGFGASVDDAVGNSKHVTSAGKQLGGVMSTQDMLQYTGLTFDGGTMVRNKYIFEGNRCLVCDRFLPHSGHGDDCLVPDIVQLEQTNAALLEALEDLVTDYEEVGGDTFYDDSYKAAKEAIRKATE